MKFAYADPPYIGCGHLYPENAEVNHAHLLDRLISEYPDGWALSCSSPSLEKLIGILSRGGFHLNEGAYRIMPWVKPFAVFKPNVGIAYAWEPVIVMGGRKRTRKQPTIRDWHSANITLKKNMVGAKPESFCEWICDVLNVHPGDELDDLYPGTGIMGYIFTKRIAENPAINP